jgi:hypothetical protein
MELVLLTELRVVLLFKDRQLFYETRSFVIVLTRAWYWFLSWARSIKPKPFRPISLIILNIVFLSTPMSSKWSYSLKNFYRNFLWRNFSPPHRVVRNDLSSYFGKYSLVSASYCMVWIIFMLLVLYLHDEALVFFIIHWLLQGNSTCCYSLFVNLRAT